LQVLYWLSGLTCTDENFVIKAGAQRAAAAHGIALVAPDTSPRMSIANPPPPPPHHRVLLSRVYACALHPRMITNLLVFTFFCYAEIFGVAV
jgi:hypothetical protein